MSTSADPDERAVTLHSSWTGIGMSYAGAGLAVLCAGGLMWANGPNIATVGLAVFALVLLAVALFDVPTSAEFRRDGVMRRAALRHHWVAWDRVRRLRRLRVGVLRTRRDGRGGGLVADVKGRNYILVDRMESAMEYDDLCRMLGDRAELLGLSEEKRPPEGRSPTWLYRRAEWRPESARRR